MRAKSTLPPVITPAGLFTSIRDGAGGRGSLGGVAEEGVGLLIVPQSKIRYTRRRICVDIRTLPL